MSPPASGNAPHRQQARVSWGDLLPDVLLLFVGAQAMLVSFVVDVCAHRHEFFARSGAMAALISGVVAYRSLNKHYQKFLNYTDLSQVPLTSKNQRTVDRFTLILSIVGTLVWAYGDIFFAWARK
jgi:hypothetical protein